MDYQPKPVPKRVRYGKGRRCKHPIHLRWIKRGDFRSRGNEQKFAHHGWHSDTYNSEGKFFKQRDLDRYHRRQMNGDI